MAEVSDVLDDPARADDLNFRRVVHIFLRTWPFMRPALKHMAVFVVASAAIALFAAFLGFIITGLMNGGIVAGRPLGPLHVWIYGLDPRGLRERGVPLGRGPAVAVLAGDHLDHSARARGRRRRPGSLLLQHLDLPGHQPANAGHVDRPPASAIAGVPRLRPDRRRDLPGLPGQRHGDLHHPSHLPRTDDVPRTPAVRRRGDRRLRPVARTDAGRDGVPDPLPGAQVLLKA